MADTPNNNQDTDGNIALQERTRTKKPPLYRVLMLNDDYTPMDFVVEILRVFFGMNVEKATQVMLLRCAGVL